MFEALLSFVNYELDECNRLDIKFNWGDKDSANPKLVVQTKLRVLEALTQKDKDKCGLSKCQIREALWRMKDFLKILEDNRVRERGSENWHFTLTLWSRNKAENLKRFDDEWERRRPDKSKQQEASVIAISRIVNNTHLPAGVHSQELPLLAHFVERPEHKLIYDSQSEREPFASWTRFSSVGEIDARIKLLQQADNGATALEIKAFANESVGVEKSLRLIYGRVDFEYKVLESNSEVPNVFFYIIPMQQTGIGRTGLIEVGTNIQDDPRNPTNPYRVRRYAFVEQARDNQWHHQSVEFDFRKTPNAFYSIFAPRVNEGSSHTGAAHFAITKIQVLSLEGV